MACADHRPTQCLTKIPPTAFGQALGGTIIVSNDLQVAATFIAFLYPWAAPFIPKTRLNLWAHFIE
jgi:hypothetical protein